MIDSRVSKQTSNYGISLVNAPKYWKLGYEGQGTVIAMIDTGCQIDHEELKENIIDFYNFTDDDKGNPLNVNDYTGHGTHVSGIVAATNKNHIIGVAPKSKLLILKAIGYHSGTSYDSLIKAIEYAINWKGQNGERVDIINLSLGGKKDDIALREVINKALQKNIFIVAAAGNYGDGSEKTIEILYPGYYKEVIQVGAVNKKSIPTYYSNTNCNIDFLGPGDSIFSTYLQNTYIKMSGTSMAAPHISGGISLILNFLKENKFPITQDNVYQYLSSHSVKLSNYSSITQGNGILKL